MDDNTRLVPAKKKVRTAHQAELSPFALHLQDVRPGRFKLLPLGEWDCIVPLKDPRTD
jgi:hypothetical protein